MKEITLTRGYVALVDDELYEELSAHKWHARVNSSGLVYAIRNSPRPDKKTIYMHRVILGAPEGTGVDHIDRDGLNNKRANLRLATTSENQRNARRRIDNSSGYKGVAKYSAPRSKKPWKAHIGVNGVSRYLGVFDSAEEAARAYDRAAVEFYGEFAHRNFA